MINYGRQWINPEDEASVVRALNSDFLTQGPEVGEFEKELAKYVGAKYCVAVSSGTAALHLAVQALAPKKNSRGITSPNTFVASANCFLYNGMVPQFADIDPRTYCISPQELKNKMTGDTEIIIPVHFAGQSADMEAVSDIAKMYGSRIIEDASHALGSRHHNGSMVGSCYYSDMAVFSFHPVKTIATGEGGAITLNDEALYEKLLMLRTHGITKDPGKMKIRDNDMVGPWYYEMHELGFNYRMTDIQAALGRSQLERVDGFVRRRQEIVSIYNSRFSHENWITIPYEPENLYCARHLYVVKIDFERLGKSRTQAMAELHAKGIGTQVHYIPVHLQPYYREQFGFGPGDFPQAESYYRSCLSLPLYPRMTDDDVSTVREAVCALAN